MCRKKNIAVLTIIWMTLLLVTSVCAEEVTDASGQSTYVLVLTGDKALENSFDEASELRFTKKYAYAVLEDGSVIIRQLKPINIDGYEALESGAFAYIQRNGQAIVIGFSGSYSRPWDWMYPPDRMDENITGYSENLESAIALYEPGRVSKDAELAANGGGGIVWIDENAHDKGYTLVIPDRLDGYPVVSIYDGAFEEAGFRSVTLPEGITSIGEGAFGACYELDTIIIPDGVTSIGDYAFQLDYCLTDITIPESVTSIGDEVFIRCGIAVLADDDLDFQDESSLVLRVREGSYAEQYAKENELQIIFTEPDGAHVEPPYREKVTLINNSTVNIRSGPGTQFQQIGEAYPGVSFYFTGVVENDFYQIYYPDIKNNPQYDTESDVSPGALHTIAYVTRSLADVSPVNPEDSILSSLVGNLKVKPRARIYLDAALSKEAKGALSDENCVPFAGIAPNGAYAVLFERANSKGEQVLWIGFISPGDVDAESRHIAVEAAAEDEEDMGTVVRTDATGQWKYVLDDGNAVIMGYDEEPVGDLAIPDEVDGYPVTGIGDYAFSYCVDLTGMTIPNSVITIGNAAFYGCYELSQINLPNSLISIGGSAFAYCEKLTLLTLPDSLVSIGGGAFSMSGLRKITLPESLTSLDAYAFSESALEQVTFSDSLISINDGMFWRCESLEQVILPKSLVYIGDFAFMDCAISDITIPGSVFYIGRNAFAMYADDITFHAPAGSYAERYADENDIPFVSSSKTLPAINVFESFAYVVNPDGKTITIRECRDKDAFQAVIPGEIDGMRVTDVGVGAFINCALSQLTLPDTLVTIGDHAFRGCSTLTHITLPDSVISIGDMAFYRCNNLVQVTLPDSVTHIGSNAFRRVDVLDVDDEHPEAAIHAPAGSYAQQYAKDNGIPYAIAE